MQTELLVPPPIDTGNQLASQALPPVQRGIVLGMWGGLLLFGTVALWPVGLDVEPWSGAFFGAWLAQACLLALWAGFAQQPLTVRLPRALGVVAVLTLTSFWADGRGAKDNHALFVPLLPTLFLMLLPPLPLVRWLLGWRIGLPEEHRPIARRTTTQFSLRQLLVWMVSTAILLAWAKCVLPVPMAELWISYSYDALQAGVFLAVVCLPILIPSVGLVLARTKRVWAVLGSLVSISLVTLFFHWMGDYRGRLHLGLAVLFFFPSQEGLLPVAVSGGGFLGTLFGTLLVLRFCGYRLLRRREEQQGTASRTVPGATLPACEAPTPVVQRPRTWRTPFPYLVVATLLIGLTLCWPAWQPELRRREIAMTRSWEALGASLEISEGGEIESIRFDRAPVSVAGLRKLQGLRSAPTFRSLNLDGKGLTDDQMHYLQGFAELRSLSLGDSPLTDAGLAQLQGLDSLENLRLPNTHVTDDGVKYLQRFGGLKYLDLQGTPITGVGFAQVPGLPRLQLLNLAQTPMSDAGLLHLQRFENLTGLELNTTGITGAGLAHLAGLRKLQCLGLAKTAITDESLSHLASLEELWALWLNGTPITDAGLRQLASLKELSALNLANTQITDAGLSHLRQVEQLEDVSLEGTRITDAGLMQLRMLKKLWSLGLTGTAITDAGLVHLATLTQLTRLTLARTQITDAGLKQLAQLENLRTLSLAGTKITDAGLVHLHTLRKLRELNTTGTAITDAGYAKFRLAKPECEIDK